MQFNYSITAYFLKINKLRLYFRFPIVNEKEQMFFSNEGQGLLVGIAIQEFGNRSWDQQSLKQSARTQRLFEDKKF